MTKDSAKFSRGVPISSLSMLQDLCFYTMASVVEGQLPTGVQKKLRASIVLVTTSGMETLPLTVTVDVYCQEEGDGWAACQPAATGSIGSTAQEL